MQPTKKDLDLVKIIRELVVKRDQNCRGSYWKNGDWYQHDEYSRAKHLASLICLHQQEDISLGVLLTKNKHNLMALSILHPTDCSYVLDSLIGRENKRSYLHKMEYLSDQQYKYKCDYQQAMTISNPSCVVWLFQGIEKVKDNTYSPTIFLRITSFLIGKDARELIDRYIHIQANSFYQDNAKNELARFNSFSKNLSLFPQELKKATLDHESNMKNNLKKLLHRTDLTCLEKQEKSSTSAKFSKCKL